MTHDEWQFYKQDAEWWDGIPKGLDYQDFILRDAHAGMRRLHTTNDSGDPKRYHSGCLDGFSARRLWHGALERDEEADAGKFSSTPWKEWRG